MNPRAFLQALLAAALFGAATPASKALLAELPPEPMAGLFYLGAAAGLFPFVLVAARRERHFGWPRDRTNRRRLLGAILFGGVLGPLLLLWGLERTSAASGAMLLNLETPATALLALVLFREHLGRLAWIANAGLVLAGLLLSFGGGRPALIGGLLVALATVAWGLDNNLTALIDGITPTQSTFWKGLVAGSFNLALAFVVAPAGALTPSLAWLGALSIGVLGYGLSIVLYISAAQSLGAARSQMVFATAPFWGVVLAVVGLGETLGAREAAAIAVIMLALALLFLEQHAHPHVHEAQTHTHAHRHDDGHHDHTHPGLDPSTYHSHEHTHARLVHDHAHLPDIHHRHSHKELPELEEQPS